jgi:Transglycosylase-like domain
VALAGEHSTVQARTALGKFRGRRSIAVAGWAPLTLALVSFLLLPVGAAVPAGADQSGPDPAQVAALTTQVTREATRIHQLTEQLDQARLQVSSTTTRLAEVSAQHDTTVHALSANRAVLLGQAIRAYMQGGAAQAMPSSTSATADMTLGREYLRVASGDLTETADQLRQTDANLRAEQAALQSAQQANLAATAQLQVLRTNALAAAATAQSQLDSLQAQLAAQAQAQAQAQAAASAKASSVASRPTQGGPVNNGLVSVVQQAAGLPIATPLATSVAPAGTTPTTAAPVPAASSGGGHAGGVWLSLRRCESSDNYTENTGNGFYGAYQFSQATWTGLGYPGRPDQESPAMQDDAAMKLQAQSGWGQWPACSAALGLT